MSHTENNGESPFESIIEAVEKGNGEKVRELLHRNSDIIWQKGGPHDWTPMHYAMWNSRLPIARLILSAKGDRPAADVFNHEQALFYTRSSEVVEWALDTCIKESPAGRLFDGLNLVSVGAGSLLHHCAFFGMVSPRIAQLLRHQLKERDQLGRTPIHVAVDCVNEDSIRNMVEARGDTSIDDIVCEIAKYNLHYFVHQGKVGQLKALLSLGAIQDVPSEDGSTAFTLALGTLNTECALAILESKLEPRDEIIFLAKETTKVADNGDQRIVKMKTALNECLVKMSHVGVEAQESSNSFLLDERYWNCTISYPLVNSDMEFSYAKVTEKYDFFKEWATKDDNLVDIQWPNPINHNENINWKLPPLQFHLETFHINPKLKTLDNSQEVQIWDVATLSIEECHHSYKTDCMMMQDMTTIIQLAYNKMGTSPSLLLQALKPNMTVVGSVAEGTRMIVGNEMDLLMEFPDLKEAFEIRYEDPFHLYCTLKTPAFLRINFFNAREEFQYHKFKEDFLMELDKIMEEIYVQGKNPTRLRRGNWKKHLQNGTLECPDCCKRKEGSSLLEQCSNPMCIATIAQTKSGFCLQFEWVDDEEQPFYCSIDIVPVFSIKKKAPLELARIIVTALRKRGHPLGWFHQLRKYEVCDKIVKGISTPDVTSVILKTLNCGLDRNYFIRPAQPLGWDKFLNDEMKDYYCRMKLLIKGKGVKSLDNYMLKKLLLKPEFKDKSLLMILKHEEFKMLAD